VTMVEELDPDAPPLNWRSYQCPPNSCRNPVILAESGGIQWNEIWQDGLLFFAFWCHIIPVEFVHSRIETGMFCGICRNGMQWNRIRLFGNYIVWHSLFVCCTPVNKQTQCSSLSTTNHRFPPPPSLLPTTTNHARHCCQQRSSPPPTTLVTTTALHDCPRMSMTTNDHSATTTGQKTKTAANK